jgi:exopolyphosphatase / guanosine-5'-triphosphate,3'-diphosphate pyrophosphatase
VTARGGRVAAAIDVGSNSVLLLTVALETDGHVRAIDEALATTRLGAGLRPGGALDPGAVARTRAAVVEFADRARACGAAPIWAFATGAARRAADGAAFAEALGAAARVPVEVLSGGREAALAHAAAVHGLALADATVLAVDVGGLSTELTLGSGARIAAAASVPLGALALTEETGGDPDAMRRRVAEALAATDVPRRARAACAAAVASGGTATSLAAIASGLRRYEPWRVHGATLAADRLAALAAAAADAGAAIDAGRAAILPAGACILAGALAAAGAVDVRVSDHGVRHAYLRERLADIGVSVTMEALWT